MKPTRSSSPSNANPGLSCPPQRRRAWSAVIAALVALFLATGGLPASALAQQGSTESSWHSLDEDGQLSITLWFGWSSTCPHCRAAKPVVEQMARDQPWLDLHSLPIDGPDADRNATVLISLAAETGNELEAVPVFLYAGRIRVGWTDDVEAELLRDLQLYRAAIADELGISLDGPTPAPLTPDESIEAPVFGSIDPTSVSLPLLTVVMAGLDSINPCALAVLLFLLGLLAGAGDRRRMLLIGGVFVVISGLSYMLFMAAWLNAFLLLGSLAIVTTVAGALALIAGSINVKDAFWFRRGPSLMIPASAKPGVFGRLMDLTESRGMLLMLASAVLVAIIVNAYEMLCTGGFPVIFTRVLTLAELTTAGYYGYLALYALVYVAPLVLMLLFLTWRLSSPRITEHHARSLKLVSGLLMIGLAMLLLFAPGLLTDLAITAGILAGSLLAGVAFLLFAPHQRQPAEPVASETAPDRPKRRRHPPRPAGASR